MKRRRLNPIEPKWLLVFAFFASGIFAGGLGAYLYLAVPRITMVKYHLGPGEHRFTNPTLANEPLSAGTASGPENKDLQWKLQGIIDKAKGSGDVIDAAMYYRDLEPGTWISLNADNTFSPGYQLKIPIMISYFKLADNDPGILDQTLTYAGPARPQHDLFFSGDTMTPGHEYSITELIKRMVVNSDDTAALLLFRNVDQSALSEIYSDLGINFAEDEDTLDTISLRRYSLFFRVLYNATFLSEKNSEKALSLLSEIASKSMLENNLPVSVPFVSRVGGRNYLDASGKSMKEVYECDIVYYPQHDYLLCALAHSKTMAAAASLFSLIGGTVYSSTLYRYPH